MASSACKNKCVFVFQNPSCSECKCKTSCVPNFMQIGFELYDWFRSYLPYFFEKKCTSLLYKGCSPLPLKFSIKWSFCVYPTCVFKCHILNAKSVKWDPRVSTMGLLWHLKEKKVYFPSCPHMGCGKGSKVNVWCFCNKLASPEKLLMYHLYAFQLEVLQSLWKLLDR